MLAEPGVLAKFSEMPAKIRDLLTHCSDWERTFLKQISQDYNITNGFPGRDARCPPCRFPDFLALAHGALFVNDHSTLVRLDPGSGRPTPLGRVPEMDLRNGAAALDGFVLQHYQGSQCAVGFFHPPAWETPACKRPLRTTHWLSRGDSSSWTGRINLLLFPSRPAV